ncbi:FkbM family methyltransferase [Streptomyces alkaliterrae]|uniref:FkbM family methyltransferase n=1 Tax=Streptomyces alkaliterrae TaxID=2213162 RepID=A0A5P0YNK7_9ACTN|nr:FkbM family methyltransferase [Streptomyces alkaliterrae]MBB1260238.1 FkbM family methyltransferase [Streptomyces alkaliterrae]MQS01896.1 FkbM family methyltransferase [Streptomyces alkaliterrae]
MTLAARIGPRLPPALVARAAAAVYPRFEPELRRIADFCPPGGTAVDIGGWYGPWTRRMARRAQRVVTIEPVPHLARLLRATTGDNVRVVQAAATDHTDGATLWLPPGGRGDRGVSSLVRRGDLHGTRIDVASVRVDTLELSDVRLIKIDVDGSEEAVLRGARDTIARCRPSLLVELEVRIQPPGPVVELLADWGYTGWVLPDRDWVPLRDFDLARHQRLTGHVAEHGLLRRALRPRPRYVNSVLFLPAGLRPGGLPNSPPPPGRRP